MNILHLTFLSKNKANGINVVVPQHLKSQSKYANVALYNFTDVHVELEGNIMDLSRVHQKFEIDKFQYPFNKPDIIIIHGMYCLKYIGVINTLLRKKIPYIIIPHAAFTKKCMEVNRVKKLVAHKLIFDRFIENAVAIQYLSEYEKESSIYKKNSIVLSNGVDLEHKKTYEKGKGKKLSMVYIGRKDIYHKGIDLLLDSCEKIADKLKEDNVIIKLYGPDRKGSFIEIDRIISEKGLNDIVYNLPGIFDDEKEKVLDTSDIFILTSRLEGQPVGLMEALVRGVPSLVTPGTGMAKEIEEHSCGWVSEFDSNCLAQKILYILENRECICRFGINAKEYMYKTYNWDKVSREAIELYSNLINKRKLK